MKDVFEKLRVLADGAKYDVSCSSSGVERKNSGKIGNSACAGICHTWGADGRCISLLKVLLTNKCVYDCEYCINRRSSEIERASFEPDELARLTIEFYRRNYIEGLFLSSAVERSPDYTGERMMECLRLLRKTYGFSGYIHAKIIPGNSPELTHQIGLLADRLSINIELPTKESLGILAPQKKPEAIFNPMNQITKTLTEQRSLKGPGTMFKNEDIYSGGSLNYLSPQGENANEGDGSLAEFLSGGLAVREERKGYKAKFAPAGQTTQMIIGASGESDRQIVKTSESLYRTFKLKRVYFSAYIPLMESPRLPALLTPPPLKREHRLYQADWLLRFYGFTANEILDEKNTALDLDVDPKFAWALRNIEKFPMEINKVSMDDLLRIPGIGTISAYRISRQRKMAAVKFDDLKKLGVVVKRAKYFVTCGGKYYGSSDLAPQVIRQAVLSPEDIRNSVTQINDNIQISMFDFNQKRLAEGKENAGNAGLSI